MGEDIGSADVMHEGANAVHTVDGVSWTQEEERAIVRKMDWNIVPLVWALFMRVSEQSPLFVRSTDPFFEADPLFRLFGRACRLSFLDRSSEWNSRFLCPLVRN